MKRKTKNLYLLLVGLVMVLSSGFVYLRQTTPDSFYVVEGEKEIFNSNVPFSISPSETYVQTAAEGENQSQTYEASLNLFGIIPIKPVDINVVNKMEIVPCGKPFGVKIFTEGAMIINISEVKTEGGICFPGKDAGLQKGDIIKKVNDIEIMDNEGLGRVVENSGGKELKVEAIREKIAFETILKPEISLEDGVFRAGIWVRDSSSGIGTMTFFNPKTGYFSGLGHGICDVTTGNIIAPSKGSIVPAEIISIVKGVKGMPGVLKGKFANSKSIGELYVNEETGVYGRLFDPPTGIETIEVAMKQQVKLGRAEILTTTEGEYPQRYEINIDSINFNINNPTKNILISITDKNLIEKTGGIVQGMSGSPIIQNDKLIGAITHVFVNEPTKGYAIFAETMLENQALGAE